MISVLALFFEPHCFHQEFPSPPPGRDALSLGHISRPSAISEVQASLSPVLRTAGLDPKENTHGSGKERDRIARAYISSGNATSLPDPPSSQPNLYRSHKVSTGNDS